MLGFDGFQPGPIRGLVVVPGRAQSPVDLGDEYGLVGVVDLTELVEGVNTPRELWDRIKVLEPETRVAVVEVTTRIGEWTLIRDGVGRTELLGDS